MSAAGLVFVSGGTVLFSNEEKSLAMCFLLKDNQTNIARHTKRPYGDSSWTHLLEYIVDV